MAKELSIRMRRDGSGHSGMTMQQAARPVGRLARQYQALPVDRLAGVGVQPGKPHTALREHTVRATIIMDRILTAARSLTLPARYFLSL